MIAGKARDMHYEKDLRTATSGVTARRFETSASRAGNDCDAFCSAMEQGRDGPRETVVDARTGGAVKRTARKRDDVRAIAGGTCSDGKVR